MAYENHLASLPHVKVSGNGFELNNNQGWTLLQRKSYMNAEEESLDLQKKVETAEDDDSDNVDLSAIDINDFLTLDEVGDAEEDENEIDPEGNEADKGVALTKSAIQQVIEKKDAKETEKTVVKIEVEEVKSEPEGPVGESEQSWSWYWHHFDWHSFFQGKNMLSQLLCITVISATNIYQELMMTKLTMSKWNIASRAAIARPLRGTRKI